MAISKILDIKLLNVLQPIPSYGTGHDNSNVPTEVIFLGKHANSGRGYLCFTINYYCLTIINCY